MRSRLLLRSYPKTASQEATTPGHTTEGVDKKATTRQETKEETNYKAKSVNFYADIGAKDKSGIWGGLCLCNLPADTSRVVLSK